MKDATRDISLCSGHVMLSSPCIHASCNRKESSGAFFTGKITVPEIRYQTFRKPVNYRFFRFGFRDIHFSLRKKKASLRLLTPGRQSQIKSTNQWT